LRLAAVVDHAGPDFAPEAPVADDAIPIDELLQHMGFAAPASRRRARAVLESARLTNARKSAIARYKIPAVEEALAAAFVRVCGEACAGLARDGRDAVVVEQSSCEICGGSNNQRAVLSFVRTMRRRRLSRLLVVGGTGRQQTDLEQLLAGSGVEVRCVDGTRTSHSQRDAESNLRWAQIVAIWGPTPLRHAVSNLYTQAQPPHPRVVSVARRGIEALCQELLVNLDGA
jgi:hypothetical protein